MTYVDGFVAAVPTASREVYLEYAAKVAEVFKEYGALKIVENWGVDVPDGKLTSFPMAVKCQDDETVVFSWVIWPSREVRNEGFDKALRDPRIETDPATMPFDIRRMIFGGFETILDA